MKKNYFYLLLILMSINAMAQVDWEVGYTNVAPSIDGNMEYIWDNVPADTLKLDYEGEEPTVDVYFKALWDEDYLYVIVVVEDDDHWPSHVSAGAWYEYDQAELYLDINSELKDGFGPGANKGTGHYQIQPGFTADGSGVPGDLSPAEDFRPGGKYGYVVDGENYIFEYAIEFASLKNKDGNAVTSADLEALDAIGFDVTIIDQDEGITSGRQRKVWRNIGTNGENYSNMDDAGTIALVENAGEQPQGLASQEVNQVSVYPNPVLDYMMVDAEFDKVVVTNILGIEVMSIESSQQQISVESLSTGTYFIRVFEREELVGISKILKN